MILGLVSGLLSLAVAARPVATATSATAAARPTAEMPAHARVLALQGAANFRDLGGYRTADGRQVRWGRVFRSDKLSALTPEDQQAIALLNIGAVVDLRTREERIQQPSRWLNTPADVYESPKPTLQTVVATLLKHATNAATARAAVRDFYAGMPDMYSEEYAALFKRLAAGETPLLIHCTQGKDRTGVAAAVLLRALGVPRKTVIADYVLTEKLSPPPPRPIERDPVANNIAQSVTSMRPLPEAARVELWRSDASYIEAALAAIDKEYGSIHGYLTKRLLLDNEQISSLRRSLTE